MELCPAENQMPSLLPAPSEFQDPHVFMSWGFCNRPAQTGEQKFILSVLEASREALFPARFLVAAG